MERRRRVASAVVIVVVAVGVAIWLWPRPRQWVKWTPDGSMSDSVSVKLPLERKADMFEVVLRSAAVENEIEGTLRLPSKEAADFEEDPFILLSDPSPSVTLGVLPIHIPAWYSSPNEVALVMSIQGQVLVRRLRGDGPSVHFAQLNGEWTDGELVLAVIKTYEGRTRIHTAIVARLR